MALVDLDREPLRDFCVSSELGTAATILLLILLLNSSVLILNRVLVGGLCLYVLKPSLAVRCIRLCALFNY